MGENQKYIAFRLKRKKFSFWEFSVRKLFTYKKFYFYEKGKKHLNTIKIKVVKKVLFVLKFFIFFNLHKKQ